MLNSIFFCPTLSIKLQMICSDVLDISKNKIRIKALYEEPTGFGNKISLVKHMPQD